MSSHFNWIHHFVEHLQAPKPPEGSTFQPMQRPRQIIINPLRSYPHWGTTTSTAASATRRCLSLGQWVFHPGALIFLLLVSSSRIDGLPQLMSCWCSNVYSVAVTSRLSRELPGNWARSLRVRTTAWDGFLLQKMFKIISGDASPCCSLPSRTLNGGYMSDIWLQKKKRRSSQLNQQTTKLA